MPKDTLRVFIAVLLPPDIKKGLGELAEKLKNKQDRITWADPNNIHLTLKFLGDVPSENIDSIKNIIAEIVEGQRCFEVTVGGSGVFPSERAPRVVWVGVTEGMSELTKIFAGLEEKLSLIGFPKEKRSFKPHLTLGRVKYIKDIPQFISNLNKNKENILGKMKVDSVSLIKSTLTPKGSIYEILWYRNFSNSDTIKLKRDY